jgi:YbbR domain-containing protein
VLLGTYPEEVTVQVKAMSSLAPAPSKLDLTAEIDASRIIEGSNSIRVNHADISAPSGMTIMSVSPAGVRVTAEKKLRKRVPVKITLKGKLPAAQSSLHVTCEPDSVNIEGPASQVSRVEYIATEDIDAARLKRGKEYLKNLRVPGKQVSVLRELPVTIQLSGQGR